MGARRTGFARTAKLASIPMAIATKRAAAIGRELFAGAEGIEIDDKVIDEAADHVFAVLGELKGGAMKLGQALSVAEAAVPPRFAERYREALTKLQAEAEPMPTKSTHQMLSEQLGTRWRERFLSFDDTPVAAASIGQVHRAVWSDGRDVAVKVQYPGAGEALRADLKMFEMFSGMFNKVVPGANVKELITEFIDRTEDELDYRIEANYQRAFAKEFAGDPKFFVPRMVASAPKVMVSEWMESTPLSRVIKDGTKHDRDRAGMLLTEFALSSPARVGYLHCDPHPGNFHLLPDGRLGIVDFGACAVLPNGIPAVAGRLLRLAMAEDYEGVVECITANGFVRPGTRLTVEPVKSLVGPVIAEINGDSIHFTRKMLQAHVIRVMETRNEYFSSAYVLKAPADSPEYAMLGRVFGGIIGICAQLDAEGPFTSLVETWLPGFVESDIVA